MKKTEQNNKKKPEMKICFGRFSITVWRQKRLFSSGDKDDIGYIEKEVELVRLCIQHSVKNKLTGKWRNQQIWINPDDLLDLSNLLDKYDGVISTGSDDDDDDDSESNSDSDCSCNDGSDKKYGEDSSPSSSFGGDE